MIGQIGAPYLSICSFCPNWQIVAAPVDANDFPALRHFAHEDVGCVPVCELSRNLYVPDGHWPAGRLEGHQDTPALRGSVQIGGCA